MKEFLIEANRFLYRHPDTLVIKKLPQNEAKLIEYRRNDYIYKNYFTEGKRIFGQIVISKNNKPVWCMQFNGGVIIPTLGERESRNLRFVSFKNHSLADQKYPIRGPRENIYSHLHYFNDIFGSVDNFQGHEYIQINGETCFIIKFWGGSLT